MPNFPFNINSTALIVIDMQNAFLDSSYPLAVPDAKESVDKINQLITICRNKKIPIIWTTHVLESDLSDAGLLKYTQLSDNDLKKSFANNGEGVELYSRLQWQTDDFFLEKNRFSAFYNTELERVMNKKGLDTLIVAGTILNVCCESTIRDAFFRDFKTFFPTDINSTVHHDDVGFGSFTAEEISNSIYTSLGRRFTHLTTTQKLIEKIQY